MIQIRIVVLANVTYSTIFKLTNKISKLKKSSKKVFKIASLGKICNDVAIIMNEPSWFLPIINKKNV